MASHALLMPDFSLQLLFLLAKADCMGKICTDKDEIMASCETFAENAQELNCYDVPPAFEDDYSRYAYLAGKTGAAFVRGLQGKDPRYLKAVATPKHFTANNEEHNRFSCNARMSEKSFREYHLEPFRIAVQEGHPAAVMAA